ncbi:hypothetical protein OV079_52010 [Nannocystis pusilla]|uniref:Uncharacterized protein n=1 Tax=Nannocystis pusilla TaxID=889268 RepID=A0A9X3J2L0_9BACT|nr:hypothetical protein [Nannocystis pusilla]MCY1013917.1 hypothetical protein [Nannocystis pusilla]
MVVEVEVGSTVPVVPVVPVIESVPPVSVVVGSEAVVPVLLLVSPVLVEAVSDAVPTVLVRSSPQPARRTTKNDPREATRVRMRSAILLRRAAAGALARGRATPLAADTTACTADSNGNTERARADGHRRERPRSRRPGSRASAAHEEKKFALPLKSSETFGARQLEHRRPAVSGRIPDETTWSAARRHPGEPRNALAGRTRGRASSFREVARFRYGQHDLGCSHCSAKDVRGCSRGYREHDGVSILKYARVAAMNRRCRLGGAGTHLSSGGTLGRGGVGIGR